MKELSDLININLAIIISIGITAVGLTSYAGYIAISTNTMYSQTLKRYAKLKEKEKIGIPKKSEAIKDVLKIEYAYLFNKSKLREIKDNSQLMKYSKLAGETIPPFNHY